MKAIYKTVNCVVIENAHALDPIYVFFDNHESGKGRLTISCYSSAWTAYWGSMGGMTLDDFIRDCNAGYVASKLICHQIQKTTKANEKYILRIVEALKLFLDKELETKAAESIDIEDGAQ